ncbi:hypothetical protein SteCoe_17166 [Stentor coeruleus]|uniref:Uncharacterized protein n=1 Tax=Stentor coeruleus TaxID=5963 RepID=A0A1R2BZU6_9CILI|nr:hypothetical protein SteCoe_17166 [Stentor coeruleus]
MLLLKLKYIAPRKPRAFVLIITSEEKVIDILVSEKNHQGTELAAFKQYKLYFIDISTGSISSVSFFSSDLPHEMTTVPLFKNLAEDFISNQSEKAEENLVIEVSVSDKANPFAEEDLRYSIDNQILIDEEPLIEFSSVDMIQERESVFNALFASQAKNYKKLFDQERDIRKKYELITEDLSSTFNQKMQNFHIREAELFKELESRDKKLHLLQGEILELKHKSNQLHYEKTQETEKKETFKMELDICRKADLKKETNTYKEILDKLDKKWNEIVEKVEMNHDTDPIHFVIREKDEKIAELIAKIGDSGKSTSEIDIENEIKKKGMDFKRENEYVYTVDGIKCVVFFDNKVIYFRKISGPKPIDDLMVVSSQKRTTSATRIETSKPSFIKRPSKLLGVPSSNRSPIKLN